MKAGNPLAPLDASNEIAGLIETLLATERRLEELTAGQVDTVAGRDGRTFVLGRAQAELRFREAAKETAILNALPAYISLLDVRGTIVAVNEGWRRFADENVLHAAGHGVGLNYLEVCERARGAYSSEAQQVAAGIRTVLGARVTSFSIEYPCHSPTEQRWFQMTATPLGNDPPTGVVVMHLNITARKLGEMASTRLAAVVESSQDAIVGKDLRSIITSWNKGAERIFGYTADEMVGTSIRKLNPVGQPDEQHHIVEKIKRGETVEHFETVRQTKDGTLIDISVAASPIKNADGAVVGVSIVARDITQRRRVEEARQRAEAALQSSEARNRSMLQGVAAGVVVHDSNLRVIAFNPKALELYGIDAEQLKARTACDSLSGRVHADGSPFPDSELPYRRAHATRQPVRDVILGFKRPQTGDLIWLLVNANPVLTSRGEVAEVIVTLMDVTARIQAEQALKAFSLKTERRERMLTTTLSSLNDFAHTYDRHGRFLFANQPLLNLWGLTLEAVVGKNFLELGYPPALAARLQRELTEVFETQKSVTGETTFTATSAIAGVYEYIFSPAFAADGTVDFVVGTSRDISERKRAEMALRESERNLRFLNDLTEATQSLTDPARIVGVMARMLGQHVHASRCAYADVEPDGERFTIVHDYADGCASTVGQYQLSLFGPLALANLQGGETLVVRDVDSELAPGAGADTFNAIGIKAIVCCPLLKEGHLRAMMAVHQTTPRPWEPGEIALVKDVVDRCWATIERRTAEKNLRISEKRFKALFEQAAVGVAIADVQTGRFVLVNHQFSKIAGRRREELELITFSEISQPLDVTRELPTIQQLRAGTIREFTREKRYLRPNQSEVWINVTVSAMWAPGEPPDLCIALVQDITARKQLEEQFRQAQKMEAIGTLAGGIAHDFNNVLAAIMGYTELVKMESPGNSTVLKYLDAVLQGGRRATDLVRQILAFSRQQELERMPIQLRPVVEEALLLLRATLPTTVEFETSFANAVPTVLADPSQVHQIVMNLCTNAVHAMKDRPGRLTVKLEKVRVDLKLAASVPGLNSGEYARLVVSDTGKGMDQATLSRIFEPFFTTKATGQGTGLGLAVVHGIMQSHEGAVAVHSCPGEGTTFQLYFPKHVSVEMAAATRPGTTAPWGSGERILFVDDEAPLIMVGRKVLERLGYAVETSSNATDALARVRAHPEAFDLVVTDQTMPGMTGTALAEKIHTLRPNLPIILTTGYSATLTLEAVQAIGIRQLLLKPLTIDALGSAISKVLQGAKSL